MRCGGAAKVLSGGGEMGALVRAVDLVRRVVRLRGRPAARRGSRRAHGGACGLPHHRGRAPRCGHCGGAIGAGTVGGGGRQRRAAGRHGTVECKVIQATESVRGWCPAPPPLSGGCRKSGRLHDEVGGLPRPGDQRGVAGRQRGAAPASARPCRRHAPPARSAARLGPSRPAPPGAPVQPGGESRGRRGPRRPAADHPWRHSPIGRARCA
jgi:hypothetical protein